MALDTKYIPTKYFQEIFLDKDTGCPLAGGVVKFFRDVARITPKDVFILSGSPPSYTYVNIGSEVTLSSYGTFQYDNDDVTVYLYPYDTSDKIDLYYATVESSGAIPQITREGFPNIAEGEDGEEDVINYVPNGQFLLHHDIVADEGATPAIEAGEITDNITDVAEGGWSFERTASSAAKDFVLFNRIGSYVEVPSKSPRYTINVKNESPGVLDTFKELRLTFRDVNKFASDTQKYTFAFEAKTNSGSSSIEVKLRKFYGSGGSATYETTLQVINLTSDYQYYDIPVIFGDNTGETIGDNDDDYVQLNIAFPVSSVFDDELINVVLLKGDEQITAFPDTTNAEFIKDSLAGWPPAPNYEGGNLYLPVRLGLKGFEYDDSRIGNYILKSTNDLEISQLWSTGANYRVDSYSLDHIPYRRLYEKWSKNSQYGLALYGTGEHEMRYLAVVYQDQSFATSDSNTNINNDAWQSFTAGAAGELISIDIILGTPAPTAGDTGRITIYEGEGISGRVLAEETGKSLVSGSNSITIGNHPNLTSAQKYTIRLRHPGTVYWRTNSTGGYAGGSYNGTVADAEFKTFIRSFGNSIYKLYANSPGVVTPVADGSIPTGFTFTPVQPNPYIIEITTIAASGMTAGSYWIYYTTDARKYIIWYEIDGIGTKPTTSANVYRKVSILSTDSGATVNNKTSLAINSYSFATPNWRGYLIRCWDDLTGLDPNTITRTNRGDGYGGNTIGTIQEDELASHRHPPGSTATAFICDNATGSPNAASGGFYRNENFTGYFGGNETRPKNRSLRIAVYY